LALARVTVRAALEQVGEERVFQCGLVRGRPHECLSEAANMKKGWEQVFSISR
jgi:hypothetical protein